MTILIAAHAVNVAVVAHAASVPVAPAASDKMKITKKQLKRIIREERAKLIRESKRRRLREQEEVAPAAPAGPKPPIGQAKTSRVMQAGESVWFAISSIVDQAMDQSDPASWAELADDLRGLADDVIDSIPEDA